MIRKADREEFMRRLAAEHPNPKSELNFSSPFELLVAVVLSAQATDKGVNLATAKLFPVANTPEAILALGEEGLTPYVKTIGLYRNKVKHILGLCERLLSVYGGQVPEDREALMTLPGVGRKSANLIMGDVFGKPAIVTDTHCIRLVNRMGLVKDIKEPKKVEMELWKIIPPEEGNDFCHRLVEHGRDVCTARTTPHCDRCVLNDICATGKKLMKAEQKTK